MPFFSIIISLFNKEKTILNSINSALEQSFQDFEIIIINDGSTDTSYEKVLTINNPKLKVYNQVNAGPSSARNHGIKEASGKWVVFLDSDDILLPNALFCFQRAILHHSDCDYIIGNVLFKEKDQLRPFLRKYKEGYIKNPFKEAFWRRLSVSAGSFAIKRDIIGNNPYDENLFRNEDRELMTRIWKNYLGYRISTPILLYNSDFSCASMPRNDIRQDFLYYIDLSNSHHVWEKLFLYDLYLLAKNDYHVTGENLMNNYDYRFILLFLDKLLLNKW